MRSVIREEQVFDSDFVSPEEHEGLHDRDLYSELTRLNGKVYSVDEWITGTINRHHGKVINIEYERDFDMEGI